jgi:alkyl sulfatase BDS1-like metallo-beta-lactamase superfamily hydrolase
MSAPGDGPKDATPITRALNASVLDVLPFGDTQDFEDARRGCLGSTYLADRRSDRADASVRLARPRWTASCFASCRSPRRSSAGS